MEMLGNVGAMMGKDGEIAERVTRSRAYDDWFRFFIGGDKEKAIDAWGKLLGQMDDAHSCIMLQRMAGSRVAFSDASDSDSCSFLGLFGSWIKAARKRYGENHRFTGDAYSSMAGYYECEKKFLLAIPYRKRQLRCYERAAGSSQDDVLRVVTYLAVDLVKAHRFEQARPYVYRGLALGRKLGSQDRVQKLRSLQSSILRTAKPGKHGS